MNQPQRLYSIDVQRDWVTNESIRRCKMRLFSVLALGVAVTACAPTVKIEAPDKPIEINLNVKIDQEVRVRLDESVEDLISSNPDLF